MGGTRDNQQRTKDRVWRMNDRDFLPGSAWAGWFSAGERYVADGGTEIEAAACEFAFGIHRALPRAEIDGNRTNKERARHDAFLDGARRQIELSRIA